MLSLKNSLHVVRFAIVAAVAIGCAQIAHATPVTVTNFSFENPALTDGNDNAPPNPIPGWTTTTWGTWNPTSGEFTGGAGTPLGADGERNAYIGAGGAGS
ncbi:MAG: hypothetical protein K8T91_07065 [Planctomycetes bacterium]|nr:hypothetical protein [Planctomycetota bacterium]